MLVGAAVVGLGLWGFRNLEPAPPAGTLSWPDAAYRTVRLFTLNLDIPDGAGVRWPLWVAAFVAPLVTARGVAALFKDQLAGVVTRYFTRPDVVVFGANARTAALIAAEPSRRWRAPIVVVDPDPVALATIARPRLRNVLGDGLASVLEQGGRLGRSRRPSARRPSPWRRCSTSWNPNAPPRASRRCSARGHTASPRPWSCSVRAPWSMPLCWSSSPSPPAACRG